MTIEELFGTLQMSVVATWRKHLRSAKYGKHEALDEFYKEMPEKVDALIEGWMGANGKKVGAFQNVLSSSNLNTLKYLQELKRVCKEGYSLMGDNDELKGLMDDIVNQINSTLYKVKELSESKMIDLVDFINESLIEEGLNKNDMESLKDYFYRTLDELYQDGVVAYDDDHLQDYCDDHNKIDFADVITATIGWIPSKYQKILNGYPKNNKKDIENAIIAAIEEFAAFENPGY